MNAKSQINIGLIGFGRTGHLVAKEIIKDKTLNLKWVCRNHRHKQDQFASIALGYKTEFAPFIISKDITKKFLTQNSIDVLIDFSSKTAIQYYKKFSCRGVKIVSAISKYSTKDIKLLHKLSKDTSILHSPNITLGINWLIFSSKILYKLIPEADIKIIEQHFKEKKEISGSALRIAEQLNLKSSEIIKSIRIGSLIGKHEVIFGLKNQTITLIHESTNRSAFGSGAIFALKWLNDKKSGLYSIDEAYFEKFSQYHLNS